MDDSAGNVLKFAKLNSGNYRSWAFNMKLYLESNDLFEHADGTAVAPDAEAEAAEIRIFRLKTKKAWTSICLAVEPSQQIHIRDTNTAKEAWDALKNQFARESILQKVRLRQKYYSCKFQQNGNMLEHINHLKSLHDQLREMGVEVNDQELAMTLLASLPDDYMPLITALDAVGETTLSFEKVKGMLLNDYERKSDNLVLKNSGDALSARQAFNSRRGRGNRGHISGFQQNKPERSFPVQPFTGTCHYCKEKGHFARDCPKKKAKSSYFPGNYSRNADSAHVSEEKGNSETMYEEALYTGENAHEPKSFWIIDSGATQHMTYDRDSLSDFIEFEQPSKVILGDNRTILAFGKGTYRLTTDIGGQPQKIALNDVLYLPDLGRNLLSVRALTNREATVEFEADKCKISRNSKVLGIGELRGKLYFLKQFSSEQANSAENISNLDLWHCRYGHLGVDNLVKLSDRNMVDGMDKINANTEKAICEGCIMGKQHRVPYPKSSSSCTSDVLEMIHTDVCGPMNIGSIGGSKYFVTFIDDFSRYVCVYYLKQKSEVLSKFKEFVNVMTNITGKRVKVLRSDNGGEYCSNDFSEYLKQQGIKHETTVPYNPAQNGLAERMNRTIVESARSMIHHANVPKEFWAEAVNTAVYLKNRSPSVALKDKTPYECMFHVKPNVSNLKTFGCIAYVHIRPEERKKFDVKSTKAIFVGYPEGMKGFKLYNPVVKRFIRSRDVVFDERKFYHFKEEQSSNSDIHFINPDIFSDENKPDNEVANQDNRQDNAPVGETYERRFLREIETLPEKRQRRQTQRYIEEEADYCYNTDVLTADIDEPKNIVEAWNGEHSFQWQQATDSEFASLESNDTWDLVPMPNDKNIDVCYHFIREQVTSKTISIEYCPTDIMLADVLTKGLANPSFEKFRNKLRIYETE